MISNDQLKDIEKRIEDLYKYLQIDRKKVEIANDDEKTASPEFWNAPKEAEIFFRESLETIFDRESKTIMFQGYRWYIHKNDKDIYIEE